MVLTRSDYFSDALAGGPLAAHVGGPLLITPGASLSTTLDPRVQAEIQRVLPVGDTAYILDGDLALSPDIDTTLQGLGYVTQRIARDDEYATVDIAEQLGNPSTIFEATGLNFADALSAVPAAIQARGAILLTQGNVQAPETAQYLADHPSDSGTPLVGHWLLVPTPQRPPSSAKICSEPRLRWRAGSFPPQRVSESPPGPTFPTPCQAECSWGRGFRSRDQSFGRALRTVTAVDLRVPGQRGLHSEPGLCLQWTASSQR